MSEVSAIGLDPLDLAKHGFQFKRTGQMRLARFSLRSGCGARSFLQFFSGKRACVMALEARSSAHYWARELAPTPGKHSASTEASDAFSHGLGCKRPITALRAVDLAT